MRWLICISLFWSVAMIVAMALCRAAGVADAADNPKQMGNAMRQRIGFACAGAGDNEQGPGPKLIV